MSTTYSFSDINAVIKHPNFGQFSIVGEGIGSITITQTNDNVALEVAADGTVMTSKIKNHIGTVAISIQQTSPLNQWLTKLFNYLKVSDSSEFTGTNLFMKSPSTHEQVYCNGLVPNKPADKPYQAQGQMITWNFVSDDITTAII